MWSKEKCAYVDGIINDINGNEHFKDIFCDLTCVGLDTGYEPEFLIDVFNEGVDDLLSLGESRKYAYKESFRSVVITAYEYDY